MYVDAELFNVGFKNFDRYARKIRMKISEEYIKGNAGIFANIITR